MDLTKKLTDAILLYIFSYLMELPSIFPTSAGDTGLTLLVVCRRWRYIILHSATKWTNLVTAPTVSSNRFNANVEFGRCWLNVDIQRYSGHWLNIFLLHVPKAPPPRQNVSPGNASSSNELNILKNIVFAAAKRVKCLSLPLCSNRAAESFLTAPAGQFYFLESVEICFLNCGPSEIAEAEASVIKFSKPITVFQNLPFLRRTSIIIRNGLNPLMLLLPWYQLTTIHMGFTTIPPKVFITILSKSSPSLATGFFTIKFSPREQSLSSYTNQNRLPQIFSSALQHLHLRLINPSFERNIFMPIRLPALISFQVDVYDSNAGWVMDIYHPLLCDSSNTLETVAILNLEGFEGAHDLAVHLDGPRPDNPQIPQDLETFFSILRKVRVLRLPLGLYIPKATMELISLGMLLPLLETLEVASSTGVDVLAMVKDRNEVASFLSGLVGSSSAAPSIYSNTKCHRDAPPHFSEVTLWTPTPQRPRVESCLAFLQSLSSLQKTTIKIFDMDQSLF